MSIEKVKTIVIVFLICIILLGGSFVTSELSYYKNNCSISNKDITSSAIDSQFVNIDISKYLSLFNSKSLELIVIGRDDCTFSSAQDIVLKDIIKEYNVKVNYINLNLLDDYAIEALYSSYSVFTTDRLATPTILLVRDGKVELYKKGYTSYDNLVQLLKDNNYIVE